MAKPDPNQRFTADERFREYFPEYDTIRGRLGQLAEVRSLEIDLTFAFSTTFVQAFLSDIPDHELSEGVYGASRSNWTYHTAIAIAQTSKMMGLTCKFEALGKRDAVIETRDDEAEVVLIAEWEWDYDDVFGNGKELDKLQASCKLHRTADAFLLTYCPARKYVDFLERTAEVWLAATNRLKSPPTLFFHSMIFEEKGGVRIFDRFRTVEIHVDSLRVWSDHLF